MPEDKELERVMWLKVRSKIKRSSVISQIRAIHAMALRVSKEKDLVPEFLVMVTDLDALWALFKSEDDNVLDFPLALNLSKEYAIDLISEECAIISVSKSVADELIPKGRQAIDLFHLSNLNLTDPQHQTLEKTAS